MCESFSDCLRRNVVDGLVLGAGGSALLQLSLRGRFDRSSIIKSALVIAALMSTVNGATFLSRFKELRRRDKLLVYFLAIQGIQYLVSGNIRRTITVFLMARVLIQSVPSSAYLPVSVGSNFIILKAFLSRPDLLAPSYLRFLYKFTDQDPTAMDNFRSEFQWNPNACTHIHYFEKECTFAIPTMFWNTFSQHALPIYIKLYSPMLIISLIQSKFQDSATCFNGFLFRTTRSSVMLSSYISLVMGAACCAGVKIPQFMDRKILLPTLGAVSGSLAFYVESEGRRMQLVQFMLMHSLDVLANYTVSRGLILPELLQRLLFSTVVAREIVAYQTTTAESNRFMRLIFDHKADQIHKASLSKLLL